MTSGHNCVEIQYPYKRVHWCSLAFLSTDFKAFACESVIRLVQKGLLLLLLLCNEKRTNVWFCRLLMFLTDMSMSYVTWVNKNADRILNMLVIHTRVSVSASEHMWHLSPYQPTFCEFIREKFQPQKTTRKQSPLHNKQFYEIPLRERIMQLTNNTENRNNV